VNPNAPAYAPLIAIAVVVVVLFFRLRRLSAGRRLRLEWLWVTPAILLAVSVQTIFNARPVGADWAWMGVALILGGALGWMRGRMMRIDVDAETHALNMKASPAAMLFIVGLLVLRLVLKTVALQEAGAWRIDATLITDVFIAFAIGVIALQRVEMWLRGQRLLAEARAVSPRP
jgi:membrane protein CcdC involved in cytochrome C biogenesis